MKKIRLIVTSFLFFIGAGISGGMAQDFKVLHQEPLPAIQPIEIGEPVAVPETIGATLLAGVGFFMMFRRRRY